MCILTQRDGSNMTYYTHTADPIGVFTEKEHGNYFEFSNNPDNYSPGKSYPHIVWVGDDIGHGYRYATVKKTVAYVVVDEDEYGLPVIEKWNIKQRKDYFV